MVNLHQLHQDALKKMETINIHPYLIALRAANDGAVNDVLNSNGCAYYQWTPGFLELFKPKQIVELGGAMGVWDLMALNGKHQDFTLYSVTLAEHGLEFSYVVDKYPNFIPLVGDDLDIGIWPKDCDLSQTDLWFFDSLHTEKQLRAELELYKPHFKKGAILMFDDIRMDELWPVWQDLPYEKLEVTNPLHYTGFGLAIV